MKKKVLISGGTGFIGKKLTELLIKEGYSVSVLSRKGKQNTANISYFLWDIVNQTIDESAVINADYIIHLAGEGIAEERWSESRKINILNSRVKSIELIFSVLKKHDKKLDAFISASGIGIYGAQSGSEICSEEFPVASDFLGTTCQKWEASADCISEFGIRVVKLRTGLVLGKEEGILKKLTPVFKYKLGAALGSGKQFMPWIHVDDLCNCYLTAIQNPSINGAYNVAVSDDTDNEKFSKTLARCFGYSIWLPNIPAFLLELALGEMAKLLLTGRRVSSEKITNTGFQFQFENLEKALSDCL